MGLDTARKHLQLDVALVVERDDPSNPGIGIIVSDHDVVPDLDRERGSDIGSPRPEPTIVGHVHEVDGDVVLVRQVCLLRTSLPLVPPAGVGDRIVEAAVEAGESQLAQVRSNEREVRTVEGGHQREPCCADTTERRQADTAVDDEPQWC